MLRLVLPLVALVVVLGAGAAAADLGGPKVPDATVTIEPEATPRHDDPDGLLTLVEAVHGERYVWNVSLVADYTVVDIRVQGDAVPVERGRQLVPTLDEDFFHERRGLDVWDLDHPARVLNVSGGHGAWTLRLGLPGPGTKTLVLERDAAPPGFLLGPVRNLTHYSFLLTTATDEYAFADLRIRPTAGGEEVRNPTPTLALEQTFPVQGLRADTEYTFRVVFTDWAGNTAESAPRTLRTTPEPDRPRPIVTALEPAPDASLHAPVGVVRARIDSPESRVSIDGVRLFVDKREVERTWTFDGTVLEHVLAEPLGPGYHSVGVEATNAAGGRGTLQWTFTVERETPAGAVALVALLGAAALGSARAQTGPRPTPRDGRERL